jgi:PAS domain S-box-containing protein
LSVSSRSNAQAPRGEDASAALLRAVIETTDDAVLICDADGYLTSWSATAERLFGWPASEVLEGPLHRLFADHLRNEVRTVTARVTAGEPIKHFETEVVRADGLPMPVSLSLCPIFDADQVVVASVVVARDVTEQRLTQATLAEVEARLAEGEALAHLGSWLWDLRTGAVQWSTEFHRIHGLDPLEFGGTLAAHLAAIHPDDKERVRAAMEQAVTSGRPVEIRYRIVQPGLEVRVLYVRAQATMGSDGRAVGLRGIGQDITGTAAVSSHS